jgi:predicted nucleic acid-binding protein
MNICVFDSYAIITFFEKEKGFEKLIDIFTESLSGKLKILINIVNWGEVYYIVLREQGSKEATLFEESFKKLPVEMIYCDYSLTKRASEFKAFNTLSYADCFAAATASIYKAALVTGDKEFLKLEKDILIEWL